VTDANVSGRLVKVYKTRRKADMYLFVDFAEDLGRVPETLLQQFGTPELALSLSLTADKKLARAEAGDVLEAIAEMGYFLQMPPLDGGVDAEIERARKR
jgi:uncharacterized protein YcgL (UPF0745 family)